METLTWLCGAARLRLVVGLGVITLSATPALAQAPELGTVESFAALVATTVTNSGATTLTGDLGVGPGGTIAGFPPGTIVAGAIHVGNAVAALARIDAAGAFDALATAVCPPANELTGQDLGGKALSPGVYCFDADAALTGVLTLTGAGPWIFQIPGSLTTASASSIVLPDRTQACDGSSVFWQVGGATASLGPGSTFVGSLLARTSVSIGAGAIVDGRVITLDGALTLETNTVSACSAGHTVAAHAPVKVTGGGQIGVPSDPTVIDPQATGSGRANYGFNAHPAPTPNGLATGHLNYLNHVTGLHGRGTVTDVDVLSIADDGTPKLVRFSGICEGMADCTFSVAVEDNGEPGRDDRFGIVVLQAGQLLEARALRTVNNGNIQVHESLSTGLNAAVFDTGDPLRLSVSLTPGTAPGPVDVYLVLRLPDGQHLSWTGGGFVAGIVPVLRNVVPVAFSGVVLQFAIPPEAPKGAYAWLSALTIAGTLELVTSIVETPFTIK